MSDNTSSPLTDTDTPQEEELYRTLAAHSDETHMKLDHNQVRVIKRMFDRADKEKSGMVQSHELEEVLLRIGDDAAHRVLKDLVEAGLQRLSFKDFVRTVQSRLSTEEAVRLMDMEVQYIQSMGLNPEELEQMEQFRATKAQRKSFSQEKHHHAPPPSHGSSSDLHRHFDRRRSSVPNDVDDYRREFGLEDDTN